MSFRRPLAALALLALTSPAAASAQASQADRDLARSLALEGYNALDRHDYPTAVARFERASALFHAASVELGLARAQAGIGRLVTAQATYDRIVREGVPAGAPAALAKAVSDARIELDALRPRVPGVTIVVSGAGGASVTVDGSPLSGAALGTRLPVDPGAHVIRATAPGFRAAEATVRVAEGGSETVTLELRPEAPAAMVARPPSAIPPPPPLPEPTPPAPSSARKIAGAVLMGAGGVGGVLGAVFAVEAHSKYAALDAVCPSHVQCPTALASDLSSYHTVSTASLASFIAGGALLGTGLIVYLTAPRATAPALGGASPAGAFLTARLGVGTLGIEGGFR